VRKESAARSAVCLAHMYHDGEYSMSRLAMLEVVIDPALTTLEMSPPMIVAANNPEADCQLGLLPTEPV
jgi:hypothetical protein